MYVDEKDNFLEKHRHGIFKDIDHVWLKRPKIQNIKSKQILNGNIIKLWNLDVAKLYKSDI